MKRNEMARYTATHTIDINDDAFAGLHIAARRAYLAHVASQGGRVAGDKITVSGHAHWTRDQAVSFVRNEIKFVKSWSAEVKA